MAHFAELDQNNKVIRVVVIDNEDTLDANNAESEEIGVAFCQRTFGGVWKQTSYNSNFRKNYAGLDYVYDSELDAFIPPKPYPSWVLDPNTASWRPPVPIPEDNGSGEPLIYQTRKRYVWDEASISWKEVK